MSTSVLIVEDDAAFRQRFAGIVAACPDLTLAGAVASCADALIALRSGPVDVLLCDLGLPDGDGADVVREARRLHPDIDALVITVFGDEPHVMHSLEAGATGYLLKDSLPEDITATIKLLHEGGSPIHPTIARRVLQRFAERGSSGLAKAEDGATLSARETEVLNLVAKGFRTAEIAAILEISAHTVATHIKKIYRKLEVTSRGEAVYEASRRNLI